MSLDEQHIKGMKAEALVALRALDKGYIVSKPLTDYSRYDFILDDGKKLVKAQVKYAGGQEKNGAVQIHLEKKNRNNKFCYTKDEIDLILIVFFERNLILAFGPDFFHEKTGIQVRFIKPKNNQKKFNWFEDFVW